MLTLFITPWHLGFEVEENLFYEVLDWIWDISFGIDLVLNFMFAYVDKNLEIVDKPRVSYIYLLIRNLHRLSRVIT